MFRITVFLSMILFFLSSLCFAQGEEDSITITTYYPSPYGVYKTLRLYPNNEVAPEGACTNAGEMSYHQDTNSILFCNGTQWKAVAGGAGDFWAASGDGIYNTNNGNVGIGTMNPTAKLDVRGVITTGGAEGTSNPIELNAQSSGNRYSYVDFHGDDTYTDYGLRILRYNIGANAESRITHRGTGILRIYTPESGSHIILQPGGNVGIGTTSPGYKLDVSGQANASEVCIGGDCKNSWPAGGGGSLTCTTVSNGTSDCTCPAGYARTGCSKYGFMDGWDGVKPSGANGCRSYGLHDEAYCYCCKIQ